jgi:hypothetical protein
MSKFKFFALISAVCLIGVIFCTKIGFSQSPRARVQLITSPPVSQITPFEAEATKPQSPVLLKLKSIDAAGNSLENAKINLKILTPPKNPWFTTDFPIVEGTKLLEMEAIAPQGELQIQQMFPIRGTYQLLVNVAPTEANTFVPFEQKLTLSVPENWLKYRNFFILAGILLVVGLIGGLAIAGQQQISTGEVAPTRVRLLLSGLIVMAIAVLLFVNVSAEIVQSQMSMPMSHLRESVPENSKSGIIQSQGLEVQLSGDPNAKVGTPANLKVQLIDTKTNVPVTDAVVDLKTTQLENNWLAFAYQGVLNEAGKFAWQQQFFDGAPHKIEVKVAPKPNAARQFEPFQVRREIEVEGVAPPLLVRSIVLGYLIGIVGIGLLSGFYFIPLLKNKISHRG